MRAGWNPDLEARVRRADPDARLIVEAVVTSAEDVRRREDEWDQATTTGPIVTLPSGGARLAGAIGTYISQTTRDDWITDLDPAGVMHFARLRWPVSRSHAEVTRIRTWLHPRLDGGQAQEVAWWECRVYRLMAYDTPLSRPIVYLETARIASERVQAGSTEGEVTFDFSGSPLQPAVSPPERLGAAPATYQTPVSYIEIVALKEDGSPAGNVGWAVDSTETGEIEQAAGVRLAGWQTTEASMAGGPGFEGYAGWWKDGTATSAVPYIVVEHSTYGAETLTFEGAAQIDLGAPPAAGEVVEFVCQGETPGGSVILYEVLDDAGTTWVPIRDGRTTDELATVSARRIYVVRTELQPNALGDVSPTVRNFGARALRRWTLDGLTKVQLNGWKLDPVTLRSELPQATIEIIRDGSQDYRDFATELLAEHPVSEIEFRLWIGSDSLDRGDWLMVDLFEVEDYDPRAASILFSCVSPLARLRVARLPVYDEVGQKREPLAYANQSLTDVYADLIDGQAALPGRYRGPGVVGADLVGKTIEESDAKTEADAIAYLAGMAVISSQGALKAVEVAGASGIRAIFPAEEIRLAAARPGLSRAVPEFFVPHDYSDTEGRFRGEARAFHLPALEAVRAGRVDAPGRLDDEVARWIATPEHAKRVTERHVGWFGTGLIQLDFSAEYAHPYLEPGDVILVETRQFVARDPNTARSLRGVLWALAVVTQVRDPEGREFTAWVRSYADLIAASETAERIGDTRPEVLSAERIVDAAGAVDVVAYGNSQVGYLRAAASTAAFPDEATVDAAPAIAGRVVAFDDLITLAEGQQAFITIRGYERSDGQGAKSPLLQVVATRPGFAGAPPVVTITSIGVDASSETLRITGVAGADDPGPIEWRYRVEQLGVAPGAWGPGGGDGWAAFDGSEDVPFTRPPIGRYVAAVQVRSASGRVGSASLPLALILPGLGPGGLVEPGQSYEGLPGLTVADTIDDAAAGRLADDDLEVMEAGGYVARAAGQVRALRDTAAGVDVTGATARIGARLIDVGDATKLPATEAVRASGASLEAVTSQHEDSGHLAAGAKQTDGAGLRGLVKGVQEFFVEDGDPITFDPPFQDTPVVIIQGPAGFVGSLGNTQTQYRWEAADELSAGAIQSVILKMVTIANPTSEADFFPAGTIDEEGEFIAVGGLEATASDGKYKTFYDISLSCQATAQQGSIITVDVIVSVDSKDGAGTFIERGTKQYTVQASNGQSDSLNLLDELIEFTNLNIGTGDDVRVKIKMLDFDTIGAGGTFSVSVDPVRVQYTTFTRSEASQTDASAGMLGRVLAFGAY